jgi:ABC-type transport system involved in multi-copper enzyme maturation permease subunit
VQPRKIFNLNVWPVLQRELRENSRRSLNHWMRMWAAGAGTGTLWAIMADPGEPAAAMGPLLFAVFHGLLLFLIGLSVPIMAADCIAREKREGTLGLLFLTPLSAMGIVLGKGMVLALRAFTLWLAVLPVLTIPFLLGGIGQIDVVRAIGAEFCVAVLSLAAGLLASSVVKSRGAAFFLAPLLALCFVAFLAVFLVACFAGRGVLFGPINLARYFQATDLLPTPLDVAAYPFLYGGRRVPKALFYSILTAGVPLTLLLFSVAALMSAWFIERSWQDKGPSRQNEELEKRYCTPVFHRWFSRRMQRALDRNPIAWLQQYSWKARLTKWGLCLALLLIECVAVSADSDARDATQVLLTLVLGGACTFVGVNSFLAEKRNGALELLLVTPISVKKIIIGRVVGLWKQFLPAALLLAFCDLGDCWIHGEFHFTAPPRLQRAFLGDYVPPRVALACLFLALPFCATYFAL